MIHDFLKLWSEKKYRYTQSDIKHFIPKATPGMAFYNVQVVMNGSGYQEFLPANLKRRYLQFQLWEFTGEFIGVIFENGPQKKISLPSIAGPTDLSNRAININSLTPVVFNNPPVEPVTIILRGSTGTELVRAMITEGI